MMRSMMRSSVQRTTYPDSRISGAGFKLNAWGRAGIYGLSLMAIYYFVRAHVAIPTHYLKMSAYLGGTERLPFQRRLLPVLLLNELLRIHLPSWLTHGSNGFLTSPVLFYLFVIDLAAFAAATYFCIRLYYKAAAGSPRFGLLVLPIFLYVVSWTYIIHSEANYYYPYDMLSLAFFTAGLYFIYTERFLPLLAVMLVGTFNRETTLFLIPLFAFDAIRGENLTKFERLRRVPWVRTALLTLTWLAVQIVLHRLYAHNDRSEDYLRLHENLLRLKPRNWPQILGGCGYLLPVVLLCRRWIPNPRVASWILIVPLWVVSVILYGVLTETRVYGELCALVAVSCALLLDAYCRQISPQ